MAISLPCGNASAPHIRSLFLAGCQGFLEPGDRHLIVQARLTPQINKDGRAHIEIYFCSSKGFGLTEPSAGRIEQTKKAGRAQ
jgi:hypothetical protein